jgi:aspartyl-tRNA(Asn)/glutamyl-tRNA(Gln) amidotransferase subunit A
MIASIAESVASGKVLARTLVDDAITRAEAAAEYNAVIAMTAERARTRADDIDAAVKAGKPIGRLAGVSFIAKDNFLTFGAPTTAASKMLSTFEAPFQATAIQKLEAEGAICIGKANLDAFAHGGSTENSAFGPTKNAQDQSRVAGGSSGGSAVSVALAIVPFALGTDTGGSIRQPASFNGVVGIKPTYGAVSRYGVVAMASSTDTIGVMTKNVADAELIMDIITGRDVNDSTTLPDFFEPAPAPVDKKRIGVVKQFMDEGVDPEVRAVITQQLEALKADGHSVEEVSMPILRYSLAMYYVIVPAEVSSNLARYDGIRYGLRSQNASSLDEVYGKSRDEGFMDENKRRIMIGNYVLSSGYYDAYYQQAQKARTLLVQGFSALFEKYDILVGPVAPTPAFKLGENTDDPIKMYLADVMSVPASLAGLPAISIPAGKTKTGLPIGMQLIGARQSDADLMAFARTIEKGVTRG